ncbi:hypothetical protein EUX98_g7971 [Antrodiella citrinella]|uniref:CENP-V/GFA domain-containing protein n=1 Tax=Antrodiella citrinella TaxID=2447956 RepID=A0A4S4MCH9_9APHY|nr:hypothetical protein EUX98_g7971 [Antrodiella citrinella]
MSTKQYHGSCLCSEVGFEVNADPVIVSTCHCKNCKKFTGTVFTTNVVFPAGSARITRGQPFVSTYYDGVQDSQNALTRIFCSRCASPLYNLGGDFGKTLSVFYSALDDFNPPEREHAMVPEVEYYAKDRLGWVVPVAGALQASTKPGR